MRGPQATYQAWLLSGKKMTYAKTPLPVEESPESEYHLMASPSRATCGSVFVCRTPFWGWLKGKPEGNPQTWPGPNLGSSRLTVWVSRNCVRRRLDLHIPEQRRLCPEGLDLSSCDWRKQGYDYVCPFQYTTVDGRNPAPLCHHGIPQFVWYLQGDHSRSS